MDKENAQKLINSETVKDFIDVCPHCGSKAHLRMLFNESYKEKNRDLIFYVLFKCVPCHGLILETYHFKQNKYSTQEQLEPSGWRNKFPTEEVIFVKKFESLVPEDVLSDFKEGVVSLANKCPRAAVAMFRRSLQMTLIDLGADADENLINQINNIGNLTQDIKDWAHNIRIFGNWGVHPQDDSLKDVDIKKAKEAQSFLEEFFNYVYVMPSRVVKARGVNNQENGEISEDKNNQE